MGLFDKFKRGKKGQAKEDHDSLQNSLMNDLNDGIGNLVGICS